MEGAARRNTPHHRIPSRNKLERHIIVVYLKDERGAKPSLMELLVEDDGYWKDVEQAYLDCINEGMTLPEDELWQFAKKRARTRYCIQLAVDKAKRDGRDCLQVLKEEKARRERSDIN